MEFINNIKFDDRGLVPAIVQDADTGDVLMLAYMNEESLKKSIETEKTWFYSRSRQELWNKGATSGNTQKIISIDYDCDGDAILVRVKQNGNACHTGEYSCFYNSIKAGDSSYKILEKLYNLIENRKDNPKAGSYTNYLFNEGIDKILKKVGEENAEVIIGAKNNSKEEVIYETSDMIYHMLVLLVEMGIKIEDIKYELEKRYE
ncbi:MAG: bifunctional phosphoribosyl-AMP cyclohydrolase/phosphoribosyl-ATP diphosphatase HisIE [Andreesenia angusta]|nr:bifunctional phosphoribosyl-AMP cyclohydrolase/phosphoribosyl-ATP diphosphatase HisIE [Andreesenia angusta]